MNMRLVALLPLLCLIGALILNFLCIFAGSKPSFMNSYDILTLNTSRIGFNYFNSSLSSSNSGSGSGFLSWLSGEVTSLENEIESTLNNDLESLAKDLGLKDFYSVYALDFCDGFYVPSGSSHKNVTYCSNATALFTFDPTKTLQDELNKANVDITLSQLHWPSAIQDGINALHAAFRAAFVLYCISAVAVALALIASGIGFFTKGVGSACANVGLSIFASLCLAVTSAIITAAAAKSEQVINKYGKDIDVNASLGGGFLALTWAATALALLATVMWAVECCMSRKKRNSKRFRQYSGKGDA